MYEGLIIIWGMSKGHLEFGHGYRADRSRHGVQFSGYDSLPITAESGKNC